MSESTFTYLPPQRARGILADGPVPQDLDPNHHLWKNGRMWWIAFTIQTPEWRTRRLRFSLRTSDIAKARQRRDAVLRTYDAAPGCELSLRYARRSA